MQDAKPISFTRSPNQQVERPAVSSAREEPPPEIAYLPNGLKVGQLELTDGLGKVLRIASQSDFILMANRPGFKLPTHLLEDALASPPVGALKVIVEVNEALKTNLSYWMLPVRTTGLLGTLPVCVHRLLASWSTAPACLSGKASMAFSARLARRSMRELRRLMQRLHMGLFHFQPAKFRQINAHVLTNKLGKIAEFAFPASLHVALTKNCNLKCVMCPYHSEDLKKQHATSYFDHSQRLPRALFEKLIDEAGEHGTHLSFGQYDEPFIYKGFADWAVKAKQAGCSVSITTNGTLLDEDSADKLVRANIDQISFSLDAASHETYAKIRLDDFEVPLKNMRTLVAARNKCASKTKLRACLVVQDENKHEQEAFYSLIDGLGLDMVSFYNLSTLERGVWVNNVLNEGIEIDEPGVRGVCSQLFDQMAVYPDGNVALCCLTTMYVGYRDDVPYVGNLKTDSLYEMWHSARYKDIRSEAFGGSFSNSVCRDCTIWHNFKGRMTVDENGRRMYQNAYETVVYLR
jgi:radical SAM protein with 4Fe4S-binding SPASM domain